MSHTRRFFVFLCLCALLIACRSDPRAQRLAELEKQALALSLEEFATAPCKTTLQFEKLVWSWAITCPFCAKEPASQFFPKAILDQVERWAVNGHLDMIDLLKIRGECS